MTREVGVEAFGEQLRREREQRGIALETLCQTTKVPARHIRALESGNLADLPGGVFRRGFVRSYLTALGLEHDPWMKRFEESCRQSGVPAKAEPEWAAFAENIKNARTVPRRRGRRRRAAFVLLALLLALLGWFLWRRVTHRTVIPSAPLWHRVKSLVDNATSR